MSFNPIDAHSVSRSPGALHTPSPSPEPNTARPSDALARDTLQQAKNAKDSWAYIYPEVAGLFMPQQHQSSIDITTSRPKLEAPLVDAKKFKGIQDEIDRLVTGVSKTEPEDPKNHTRSQDKNLAEIALLLCYIQVMKTQRTQNETNMGLTFDLIQKRQDANAAIKKEYFNQMDELIAKNKTSEALKWVNGALYAALAVAGIGSIALTLTLSVVTGGAALPLFISITMALINGTLGIASGSSTIAKGVLDYQNKQTVGILEEKKHERTLTTQKIKTGMDEMKESMEVVSEVWKELVKVVNNWHKASLENPT